MNEPVGTLRCPLLIGRDDLLELVDRRLAEVLAGRGQFLLVAGEAGIGKTRFLDAIDRKATELGLITAAGFVAPQDRDVPAASIFDLARTMLHAPAMADAGRSLLALRDATFEAEHVRRRRVVTEAVDQLLSAASRPTMYCFEDLQWADDLSLEIIAELARRAHDRAILLCGGYRTDEAPTGASLRDWRARLLTQRQAEEVRLRPLDETETALVTTLVLDTGLPAPRDVAAAVYDRTDGIPLHIEELLGALSADARANGYAIREATVPDTIEDAVIARLSHRSTEAQAVARAGAVIGRCFVPEVLAGIMDVPPESIEAPLQELVDHAVLWPQDERGLYDFRHQLLRDAIYRSLAGGDRRRFHARAGEFGAQLEGQSEIHSSLHFERAGMQRQAFQAALTGAEEAARLSAHRESFELYRRAVSNMPADLAPGERGAILHAAYSEATTIEEDVAAVDFAEAASVAFREAGDLIRSIQSRAEIVSLARRSLHPGSDWIRGLEALLAELDATPDVGSDAAIELRADLDTFLAMAYIDLRDLDRARAHLASARSHGDRLGIPDYAEIEEWKVAVIDAIEGDVAGGLERMARVAATAESEGRESTGVTAYRDAGNVALLAMDYDFADRMLTAGRRYADSIEQSHCAHVMSATAAVIAWADGDWASAAAQGGQTMADHGCRRGREMGRWAIGYVALGHGESDVASLELEGSVRIGETSEALEMILPPLWGLAELAIQTGAPELAIARCTDAFERSAAVGERLLFIPFVVTGVRAYQAASRPTEAGAWMRQCADHLAGVADVARPALEHGAGLVALAEGTTGIARPHLEAAVRGWDAKRRIWESTWARLDLAHCLIRSNRYADAVPFAAEARTVASRLDSRPLAERADALMRMARGRVATEEPWRPLTSREFAVARLVGQGLTNGEIADALGIAPKTASSHIEHILAKLGASRRTEIATWATHVSDSAVLH
ncbi:MAG: helix-turn-helix transcriptional regulator [Candidatus Limnocylindrales bacterium]